MANIYFLCLVSTLESSNSEVCLAYSRHTIIFIEGVMKLWHFNNVNSLFRPFRDIPVSYSSVPLAMATLHACAPLPFSSQQKEHSLSIALKTPYLCFSAKVSPGRVSFFLFCAPKAQNLCYHQCFPDLLAHEL